MLRLHCALTSADCLGEELPKGCCLASLYDWKIVNVDKIIKVTKIFCVDMVIGHLREQFSTCQAACSQVNLTP